MTGKRKRDDGSSPLPPHRARPLAVAQDRPAEQIDLPHGLAVEIHLTAPGECSYCEQQVPRITADEGLCDPCVDRWGTRDTPRGKAS